MSLLGLLAVVVSTLVLNTDLLNAASTAINGGRVAEVRVNADQGLAVAGLDTADLHGTLELLLAVAAGAVQLAEVLDSEVLDDGRAAAVVLDDLVIGALGTTANDLVDAGAGTLEGEGVYTCLLVHWTKCI